ncbi:MAG: AAA family ATPase [Burkholderiaceae bacterium]
MLAKHFLISAELLWDKVENHHVYPYTLPIFLGFEKLVFHPRVTFLVGENGSGKSTFLEAIATAYGLNAEGGSRNFNFSTYRSHSNLGDVMRLAKGLGRVKDSYFLRAESYYNVATRIEELDAEPSFGPPIKDSYGGKSLHAQSHGESFMTLLLERLRGSGLYFFDEPEAALSPARQLTFLARLHDLVQQQSQFVIATHSPIMLAYPDACIYHCGQNGMERIEYRDTEHYQLTKSFLNNPEAMLDKLLNPQPSLIEEQ